jgi:TPR repeat protein
LTATAQLYLEVLAMYICQYSNLAQSVKWFRLAAEQGHALAQFNLGQCYGSRNCDQTYAQNSHLQFSVIKYIWQQQPQLYPPQRFCLTPCGLMQESD